VVCYTNHALDQFLEDLLDIGISGQDMVRLGGKHTDRTKPLSLYEKASTERLSSIHWMRINELKDVMRQEVDLLRGAFNRYYSSTMNKDQLLEFLEFASESLPFFEAFQVPEEKDGMTKVGSKGRKVNRYYLLDRWMNKSKDAGVYKTNIRSELRDVWKLSDNARDEAFRRWQMGLLEDTAKEISRIARSYNRHQTELDEVFNYKHAAVIRDKRIIGCTTTAAAKYAKELLAASPEVLLVEEAGEILESHIITAMGPKTEQLILIGDHKQLRPKVNNYNLTVEKGDGYDLNRSLFERLILKGYPHQTLTIQHRMRPEISTLIQHMTYASLSDAPSTLNRPDIIGLRDNVVFVDHRVLESDSQNIRDLADMAAPSSKQNEFECRMILQFVRYLAQQGYGSDKMIVLTPYLGQLRMLRDILQTENDPILNDLDKYDLARTGALGSISAQSQKRSIRISTVGKYGNVFILWNTAYKS
jgi:hypothetical protein